MAAHPGAVASGIWTFLPGYSQLESNQTLTSFSLILLWVYSPLTTYLLYRAARSVLEMSLRSPEEGSLSLLVAILDPKFNKVRLLPFFSQSHPKLRKVVTISANGAFLLPPIPSPWTQRRAGNCGSSPKIGSKLTKSINRIYWDHRTLYEKIIP